MKSGWYITAKFTCHKHANCGCVVCFVENQSFIERRIFTNNRSNALYTRKSAIK